MKYLIYIVLLFAQVIFSQSAFDKGNEQYRAGRYQEAIASYESILKSGQESDEVYFNLGNAYYKLDKVAPAIYNYEKALLLDPDNKQAAINLGFAQKMAIDNIKQAPEAGFSGFINKFTGSYHYDTWAWVAVGFAFGFLLLFTGYYLAGKTLFKRVYFAGMGIMALGILVSLFSAYFIKSAYDSQRPAIIFDEVLSVKTEPLKNAQDAFILHEGTKVYITETLDNWRKIKLADNTEGWVNKDALKELKN